MEFIMGIVAIIVVIAGIFMLLRYLFDIIIWKPFFISLYQIMENASLVAILLGLITLIYFGYYFIEKKLSKKNQDRHYHSRVIQIELDHEGQVTVPLLALQMSLKLSECERILQELEQQKVISTSSAAGKAIVYDLDPLIYENWDPDDREYNENVDDSNTNRRKKWLKSSFFVIGTTIVPLWLVDKQFVLTNSMYFMIAAIIFGVFIGVRIKNVIYQHRRNYIRKTEHDVLSYSMNNSGVLYPQEIAEFTDETLNTVKPMVDKWHKKNLIAISYTEDGKEVYFFPNCTSKSMVYMRYPNYDAIAEIIRNKEHLMKVCCYGFLFTFCGAYALAAWNDLIFYGMCAIIAIIYGVYYLYIGEYDREFIERIALQVAEQRDGRLTVHELAYNAVISMEEAATLLEKWEHNQLARKVESNDGFVPTYIINGIVPQEQRLASEHV